MPPSGRAGSGRSGAIGPVHPRAELARRQTKGDVESGGRRKASRGFAPAKWAARGAAVDTMIVYRAQQEIQTASYLQEIRAVLRRLDHPMQNYLIGQYRSVSDDSTLPRRLPCYSTAYLAHRLGSATPATQTLGPDSPDGRRFKTLTARYTTLLQHELSQL
jgi:hypothetical protein